jgi:outer membrane protein assembly factor BamB
MTEERSRRWVLQTTAAAAGLTGLAGCSGTSNDSTTTNSGGSNNSSAESDDWPMYQTDAQNTGHTSNPGPTGEPSEEWAFDEVGKRPLQVVVSDGTVFCSSDTGLHAIDAETGDEQWHYEDSTHYPKTTPAVSNSIVYTVGDGHLTAFLAETGETLWQTDPNYVSHNPVVVGDTLYVSREDSPLTSFEPYVETDGERVKPSDNSFSEVVQRTDGEVNFEPNEKWSYDDASPSSNFVIADGKAYFMTYGPVMTALDLTSRETVWETELEVDELSEKYHLTVANNRVYLPLPDGVVAFDAETGEKDWEITTNIEPNGVAATDDLLLFGGGDPHDLVAISATTGEEQWRHSEPDESETRGFFVPVVSGDTVYAANANSKVYAFELGSGSKQREVESNSRWLLHTPAIANDGIYVGGGFGTIHALR